MSRGSDTSIKTKDPKNNFALRAHPDAESFASVGGRMEATLVVDHVARRMEDPGAAGIPLGQELSYVVNVYEDVMHLEFSTKGKPTKTFKINLADNVDANGKVDALDNSTGYAGDARYL